MKQCVWALAFLCSFSLTAQSDFSSQVVAFDHFFAERLEEHGIPGGAYAIVQGNKIIATAGYGVRQLGSNEPVDPYTVFRIASVSKTFAAGVASIVASQGHFNWDDKVTTYIPEFTFKTPKYNNQLKVKHLLSQSTGVMANAYDNLIEANLTPDRILPQFGKIDPLCPPGKCYGYQNVLFSLIEPIMQKGTGKTYEQLLHEHIFTPLQLPTASVGLEAFLNTKNKAMPHVKARGKWYPSKVEQSYYRFGPAAGVNASAIDLGYWLIAQLGYNEAVLSLSHLDEITSKNVKTRKDLRRKEWRRYLKDAHYALGWRVYQFNQDELVYHAGWVQGFLAEIAYSREHKLGLVLLINAESNVLNEMGTYFWANMLDESHKQRKMQQLAGATSLVSKK